jgi:hypothetical protein
MGMATVYVDPRVEMDIFDRLPRPLRIFLAEGLINFSAAVFAEQWRKFEAMGANPYEAAAVMRTFWDPLTGEAGMREIDLAYPGLREMLGAPRPPKP